jgi:hypothetical protein
VLAMRGSYRELIPSRKIDCSGAEDIGGVWLEWRPDRETHPHLAHCP